jgi:hypothetical protein
LHSSAQHSLAHAVDDGTVTEEAAFCGLTPADVDSLVTRFPGATVLVRFRSRSADGRAVLIVRDFALWSRSEQPLSADGREWSPSEIRDVSAHS